MKRKSQAEQAHESIAGYLRARYDDARRNVREWDEVGALGGAAYRRERRRLWGVALRAVERAK